MPEGQSCSEHYVHRELGQGLNKRKPGIPGRVEMPGFVPLYIRRHCLLLLYQTLITWMISALALESDSMRSRGGLLRGRTAFSIYRFDNRDRAFVIALFSCITLTAMGVILGASKIWYNPRIIWRPLNGIGIITAIGYLALCFMPMGLEIWTEYWFNKARKPT